MSSDYVLTVDNLNVHYGDLQAVHDVSMRVKRGSIVSVIGANGAGKTTLLSAVMGLIKPTSGTVTLNDKNVTGLLTSKIVSTGITMTPEGSHVFEEMTVMENLLLGAYLPAAAKKKAENLETVFRLFPVLKEKSSQAATFLSGGQRQMVAISRAIMASPDVIICDEISLGLAPIVIKDIYNSIKEINKTGVTFVLVEQEVKRILKHSDYAYVLVKGKVVMEGISSELPESEVSDAYFGVSKFA